VKTPLPVPGPPGVVTSTSTTPALPAGDEHVIDVGESTVNPAHGVPSTVTALAPVKSVPVIVSDVPPPVGPDDGATDVTVGAGVI
jgi:hypothetical protein